MRTAIQVLSVTCFGMSFYPLLPDSPVSYNMPWPIGVALLTAGALGIYFFGDRVARLGGSGGCDKN